MDMYAQYAWLIPLFPLLSFIVLTAMGRQMKMAGQSISVAAIAGSFILSLLVFWERLGTETQDYTWNGFEWLRFGDVSIYMGFEVTNLNALMLVVVTFVALLVQVYSTAYMKHDERIVVYYGYISLFTFSMLALVLSENLLQMYIFWELVGLCSFLLVGFWYHKPSARAAAKKAFIVTRIGDVGLFIGILLLLWHLPGGNLSFTAIHNGFYANQAGISETVTTWIAILIFIGAVGKSGQFPLHTWLPDAMEGPTPISALIHAATMVAAGVFLVAKTYDIFLAAPIALDTVAYVGGFTAIFAAVIAIAQNDIKRVLAYSTISQLGYMMMALGFGSSAAYTAGLFHLTTHAFFKALLFLAAGSVITALHHEQNIYKMGGLGKKMKVTMTTFAIGTLALAGVFPFAGFWSKDAILVEAYHHNPFLFGVGLLAAFFTAFYMSRLFFLVFTGQSRRENQHGSVSQVKESPKVMTVPLMVLAVLAVLAGALYMPGNLWLGEWLTTRAEGEHVNVLVIVLSNAVALLGLFVGYRLYGRAHERDPLVRAGGAVHRVLARKGYVDEAYDYGMVRPLKGLGKGLAWFDHMVIDGFVRGSAAFAVWIGKTGTRAQNGQVQTYGLLVLLGIMVIMLAVAGRRFIDLG
ncbi:NADH-quinone oxidoreductase subunit L [Marinicrinis sediminis]|uniref:NADH-quinone oxidoreductase subunit L n=1 Tax=Marinicrinis sediminis TaxID=1652465 RepID=A0ABW5RBB6_9BACL